jgi:hypothetical protein
LKGYLMALGVMDPAELIAGYLQELSAKGIQTTWKLDVPDTGRAATLPAGTVPASATERYTRESVRQRPAMASVVALGLLGAAAGGAMWGYMHFAEGKRPRNAVAAEISKAPGSGSLASFASDGHGQSAIPNAQSGTVTDVGTASETRGPGPLDHAADGHGAPLASNSQADPPVDATKEGDAVLDGDAVLVIKSSPPFAEAYVDGRYMGVTPVRVNLLEAGNHRVRLKAKDVPALDTVIALRPGPQGFKFLMEGKGETARLAVIPEEGP